MAAHSDAEPESGRKPMIASLSYVQRLISEISPHVACILLITRVIKLPVKR